MHLYLWWNNICHIRALSVLPWGGLSSQEAFRSAAIIMIYCLTTQVDLCFDELCKILQVTGTCKLSLPMWQQWCNMGHHGATIGCILWTMLLVYSQLHWTKLFCYLNQMNNIYDENFNHIMYATDIISHDMNICCSSVIVFNSGIQFELVNLAESTMSL